MSFSAGFRLLYSVRIISHDVSHALLQGAALQERTSAGTGRKKQRDGLRQHLAWSLDSDQYLFAEHNEYFAEAVSAFLEKYTLQFIGAKPFSSSLNFKLGEP